MEQKESEIALLRYPAVCTKIGKTREELTEMVKAGQFPKPFRIGTGRVDLWPQSDVDAWLAKNPASIKRNTETAQNRPPKG